jgi:predicted DNA-binding protein (MmcQ/YjbR family)
MTTVKQLCALALALPGVEQKDHFGSPSFRRNGRIFAQTHTDTNQAILKLSPAYQEILFEARADTFKPEVWGRIRWTRADLKGVAMLELRQLVQKAYEQVGKPAKAWYAKKR